MTVRYIMLSYAENIFVQRGQPIALLIQRPGESDAQILEFHARPDWQSSVKEDDVAYVGMVFSELVRESGGQNMELFDQLTEMSSGCLRTGNTGTCEESDLRARMPFIFDTQESIRKIS